MPNKHHVASVVFAALLGFSGIVAAEFQIGAEGGFNFSSVDHSFDYAGSGVFSDGVSCGSIDEIEDGIGNPVGFYGQYTWGDDGGFGVRYGHYNAGDSTIQDLSAVLKSGGEGDPAVVGGVAISKLTVDVKREFSLTGLCGPGSQRITYPAQEIDFSGIKFFLGYEKPLTQELFWTVTGSYAFYSSAKINTNDGFETTIEPSIFSLTAGLTIRF